MLRYGLKLRTNQSYYFDEAVDLFGQRKFDFIELYNFPCDKTSLRELEKLKNIEIQIHNTHDSGFHEFIIGKEQQAIWKATLELTDFFSSRFIVVHPGQKHDLISFRENLEKIDDPRILIENMAGVDDFGVSMFGQKLNDLIEIKKIKNICFDFEKAIKAAAFQRLDYKTYIIDSLEKLGPEYFHISGGNKNSSRDEHLDLSKANFDLGFVKSKLAKLAFDKDIYLVFEVPKNERDLKNDVANIEIFKEIKIEQDIYE